MQNIFKFKKQSRQKHWEDVYQTKKFNEVSWYKQNLQVSIDLILSFNPDQNASIIDVGGGNSVFVDKLIELNFKDIAVLDISVKALEQSQQRLGEYSRNVEWIVSDILDFDTEKRFDIWHDWATFHFLTSKQDIKEYVKVAGKLIKPCGYMIIATFSTEGPKKCSRLKVTQYSEESIKNVFLDDFSLIKSLKENHITPFQTNQNFLYTVFQKHTQEVRI